MFGNEVLSYCGKAPRASRRWPEGDREITETKSEFVHYAVFPRMERCVDKV